MAIVLGVNAGFVTEAPVDDPADGNLTFDSRANSTRDTSPATAIRITEIGWWCDSTTSDLNFEVGIYDNNVGDDEPENLLAGESRTNAKGTTAGWKRVTGLNITISPETIYWIAVQLDDGPSTATNWDFQGGELSSILTAETLPNPYGVPASTVGAVMAFYAVWSDEEPSAGVTRKIKIAGTFVDKPIKTKVGGSFVDKPIQIKVGGTFQDT